MKQLEIRYKIYMEAEDISQSRIHACTSYLKNQLECAENAYFRHTVYDDESDPDAFILRFYVENEWREDTCTSQEDAQSFILDLARILDETAAAHSFMDLEGEFSWQYGEEKKAYTFRSESGCDYCDFTEEAIESEK